MGFLNRKQPPVKFSQVRLPSLSAHFLFTFRSLFALVLLTSLTFCSPFAFISLVGLLRSPRATASPSRRQRLRSVRFESLPLTFADLCQCCGPGLIECLWLQPTAVASSHRRACTWWARAALSSPGRRRCPTTGTCWAPSNRSTKSARPRSTARRTPTLRCVLSHFYGHICCFSSGFCYMSLASGALSVTFRF